MFITNGTVGPFSPGFRYAGSGAGICGPVWPASGRFQPVAVAGEVDVPGDTVSWLRPLSSVLARAVGTTRSHGCCWNGMFFPYRSVTDRIGVGGHHTPPLARVVITLASS